MPKCDQPDMAICRFYTIGRTYLLELFHSQLQCDLVRFAGDAGLGGAASAPATLVQKSRGRTPAAPAAKNLRLGSVYIRLTSDVPERLSTSRPRNPQPNDFSTASRPTLLVTGIGSAWCRLPPRRRPTRRRSLRGTSGGDFFESGRANRRAHGSGRANAAPSTC